MLDRAQEIGVVGVGYVGLPLAVAFAEAGLRVVGIEKDPEKLAALDTYDSYVEDAPAERLQPSVASGKLRFTEDYGELKEAEAVVICMPTPLDEHREPDLSILISGAKDVARNLRAGALVVLESTTYPGTTREVLLPIIEEELKNGDGLRGDAHQVGRDFYLAFSPERIDPGNRRYTIHNIPKIVGGITPGCTQRTAELYSNVMEEVHPVSSPESAEMAKLLENVFRGVNIALVNELALLCDRMDVDVWEVIEAAKTKPFGFMPFYPGPGLGGHCIPVDPYYLTWRAKMNGCEPRLIELAGHINSQMPAFTVLGIADALNERRKCVRGAKILGLGVTYKRDTNDLRESPALHVLEGLRKKGASIYFADPHVSSISIAGQTIKPSELTADFLQSMDCVAVLTDHSSFDYSMIAQHSSLIFDTRNAFKDFPNANSVLL